MLRFFQFTFPSPLLSVLIGVFFSFAGIAQEILTKLPDVVFVPTPYEAVSAMLDLAQVGQNDLVYDLGSGDGRIVVAAARRGARAVGFDIDPERVQEGKENIAQHGVGDLASIQQADIFTLDLSKATVVTLYLLPDLNRKLIPQLRKLRPGSRIVSHDFDMEGVRPTRVVSVPLRNGATKTVYLWTTPLQIQSENKRRAAK